MTILLLLATCDDCGAFCQVDEITPWWKICPSCLIIALAELNRMPPPALAAEDTGAEQW